MPDRFLTIEVNDQIFRNLVKMSGKRGIHVNDYASLLLLRGLQEVAKGEDDLEIRLLSLFFKVQDHREAFRLLTFVASHYLANPDESSMDELEKICGSYGILIDDVIQAARETLDPEMQLASFESQAPAQAVAWLMNAMQPGVEYHVQEIRDSAKSSGISDWALKTAKSQMKIQSIRRSGSWVWVLPKRSYSEVEDE